MNIEMNNAKNTAKYIKFKERSVSPSGRESCVSCFRPKRACFCGELEPFNTKTRFVLLMHPLEAKPSHIGTGRLTHLTLKNSEVIVDSKFDDNERFNKCLNNPDYTPMVLYPGKDALDISEINDQESTKLNSKPIMLFIIDGTWPCAKSMMRDTTKLHNLPKLCFKQNYTSQFDIKHQPAKFCLSTLETTYHLLTHFEELGIEKINLEKKESMLKAFKSMVSFHQELAADPSNNNYHRTSFPVKKSQERIPSKKWEKRRICYDI